MPLVKELRNETTIYRTITKLQDFSKKIYREASGFEAFVVGETSDSWRIEGNGVRCDVWKKFTKNNIHKVSSDYVLRKKRKK